MVLLYILSEDKDQIRDIAKSLIEHKFATAVNIDWDRDRYLSLDNQIVERKVNLLTCVSKALLFQKIDTFIREKYAENIPELFTTPVVNIDWDLAQSLLENTEKI